MTDEAEKMLGWEDGDSCPACGALPCDWVHHPVTDADSCVPGLIAENKRLREALEICAISPRLSHQRDHERRLGSWWANPEQDR